MCLLSDSFLREYWVEWPVLLRTFNVGLWELQTLKNNSKSFLKVYLEFL